MSKALFESSLSLPIIVLSLHQNMYFLQKLAFVTALLSTCAFAQDVTVVTLHPGYTATGATVTFTPVVTTITMSSGQTALPTMGGPGPVVGGPVGGPAGESSSTTPAGTIGGGAAGTTSNGGVETR